MAPGQDMSSIAGLSPEQLQQILELGALDEQDALLADQLQRIQAGAQPSGHQYATALGAGLGGLGDVFRKGIGALRSKDVRAQQQDVAGKRATARDAYAQALLQALAPKPAPMEMPLEVPDIAEPEMIPMGRRR